MMRNTAVRACRLSRPWATSLCFSSLLVLASASSAAETLYKFTDLGALDGATSHAYGINALGQVVGESNGHAVLWSQGVMTDLGVGTARAINDLGQIVGQSGGQATLWSGATRTDLGLGVANGINNAGQIVGQQGGCCNYQAVLWNGSTATELETLGSGSSAAYDINDAGQIVGVSSGKAALWGGSQVVDLGGFNPETGEGLLSSEAMAINDHGQIVGDSYASYSSKRQDANLWSNGTVRTFEPGAGTYEYSNFYALDINNAGQFVGYKTEFIDFYSSAMLWDGTGGKALRDLKITGMQGVWFLNQATGINDQGWIVGNGLSAYMDEDGIHLGPTHAFMLRPVPEPETYVMALLGLMVTAVFVRRRGSNNA